MHGCMAVGNLQMNLRPLQQMPMKNESHDNGLVNHTKSK
jgi:hypothetical protein